MMSEFALPMLVIRFKHYATNYPPLYAIKHILTHSCNGHDLPKNMRQRMADLLQLELVKLKLL